MKLLPSSPWLDNWATPQCLSSLCWWTALFNFWQHHCLGHFSVCWPVDFQVTTSRDCQKTSSNKYMWPKNQVSSIQEQDIDQNAQMCLIPKLISHLHRTKLLASLLTSIVDNPYIDRIGGTNSPNICLAPLKSHSFLLRRFKSQIDRQHQLFIQIHWPFFLEATFGESELGSPWPMPLPNTTSVHAFLMQGNLSHEPRRQQRKAVEQLWPHRRCQNVMQVLWVLQKKSEQIIFATQTTKQNPPICWLIFPNASGYGSFHIGLCTLAILDKSKITVNLETPGCSTSCSWVVLIVTPPQQQ